MESDAGKDGSRKRMYKKCYDVEKLKKYVDEGKSNVEIAYLLDIPVCSSAPPLQTGHCVSGSDSPVLPFPLCC